MFATPIQSNFLALLAAGVVSWLLTVLLIRWAPRLGLVDHPDPRKVHVRPTPLAGGIAIFIAFTVGGVLCMILLQGAGIAGPFLDLLILGTPLFVVGLIDDLRPLPWQLRLLIQTLVALAAVLWFLPPTDIPSRAVAVFWIVGLVNAFNMLDNMDALSGGVAAIAAGYLALLGWLGQQAPIEWAPYLMLLGAVMGFLWWNRPPARIFMGDCGSTFLGLVLGVGSARMGLRPEGQPWSWAAPLCLMAVPWYDLSAVVLLRVSQGHSPFHPDKQHLSHRLVARRLSPPVAVGIIHWMALASGASAVILQFVSAAGVIGLVTAQLAAWWLTLAALEFLPRHEKSP